MPREVVLAILAVALLLYSLGAWTVVAVRTGLEGAIPFVGSESGPAPKPEAGGPASKTPGGGQASPSAPAPAAPPGTPASPAKAEASPTPVSPVATPTVAVPGVSSSVGGTATPLSGLTPVSPSPSPRRATLGNFAVEVQSVELVATLEGVAPRRQGGRFVFVSLAVSNEERTRRLFGGGGTEYSGVPPEEQIGVVLRDGAGNEFPAFAVGSPQAKWTALPQMIDPLTQKQLVLAFDVPGEAEAFQLTLRAFPSREEQRIPLDVPATPAGGAATPVAPTASPSPIVTPTTSLIFTVTAVPPTPSPSPTASSPLLTGVGGPTPSANPPSLTAPPGPTLTR